MFEFSNKDQIKLQLSIIHANTDKITEKKLADIRANIQYKWANTLNFIDNLKEINEQRKYAEDIKKMNEDKDTMSEMSTTSKNTQASNKSSMSQISINNTLAKKLSKINNNKKQTDIKIDQISFGSNKKK